MRARVYLSALSVLAAGLIAGCGGSSGSRGAATAFATPGTPMRNVGKVEAVAYVSGTPIFRSTYEHWLAVERAMGGSTNPSHSALGFLITSSWVLGEAAGRHLTVSETEVEKRLAELEHKSFPKAGELQGFLAKSRQTEGDLLARVRVEMLQSRITSEVQRGTTVAAFDKNFQAHWKPLTDCLPAYVMEDCKQYKGGPERLLSASAARQSSSASSASRGEVPAQPGAFSISSPEFERNGTIPSKYTCAGAGISPPLEWQNVPKGAVELVLFVIDDSNQGSDGGIRWIVGGIDASSKGVAEGKLPAGGIVGTNTARKAAYSPICPQRGKSDTVEFVMYALKKKIPLSAGFQPAVAEHEYGSGNDVLGQAAVNYGIAVG